MNTLRITKGADVKISVDNEQLFFVTDFCAQESSNEYPIKEYLSDTAVDNIILDKKYVVTITALSHLDKSVFLKNNFTLCVDDKECLYQYLSCKLKDHTRSVTPQKPIMDKYTIVAKNLVIKKGDASDE